MPDPQTTTSQTLPALVRSKYPGVYDDLSDAELDAKVRAKFPGIYDDLPKPSQAEAPRSLIGLEKASGVSAEPSFLERAGNAIGPTIRGAGDITGANWILEQSGLVSPGRLTGPEQNARDAATRRTAAVGGGAMMAGQLADSAIQTIQRGGARAAASLTAALAGTQSKYWATKAALVKVGVPPWIAETVAVQVSGYHKGGASPAELSAAPSASSSSGVGAPAASDVPPSFVDRYMPNVSSGGQSSYAAPANVTDRPWGSGVSAPVIDPYMPNISGAAPNVPPARQMLSVEGPFAEPPMARGPSASEMADTTLRRTAGGLPPTQDPSAVLAERLGTQSQMDLVKSLIKRGVSPSAAVKAAASGDPAQAESLMKSWAQHLAEHPDDWKK